MKLKIATWNISCGIPAKWNLADGIKKEKDFTKFELLDEVINTINNEDIDIITLQESVYLNGKNTSYPEIISKNTELKYYTEFRVSDCHLLENAEMENAILSKYPITDIKNTMFENAGLSKISNDGKIYKLFDNGFIVSTIKINNKIDINFIGGHAPAFHVYGKRSEEYKYVYKKLEDEIKKIYKEDKNIFIAGDFNTEKLLDMLPFINNNFNNNIEGITYFEGAALDYLLSNKNIKCISNKKIENMSDHLACIATFDIDEH